MQPEKAHRHRRDASGEGGDPWRLEAVVRDDEGIVDARVPEAALIEQALQAAGIRVLLIDPSDPEARQALRAAIRSSR